MYTLQAITMNPVTPPPPAGQVSITLYIITALVSGVIAFCSGILFAGVCNRILQCHKQWGLDRKKCTSGMATQQAGESPEIPTPESGSRMMCNYNIILHTLWCRVHIKI